MKLNCWEFMKCGRELGGHMVSQLGICPAAWDEALEGIHGGTRGGRACWIMKGTLCGGKKQGDFAEKMDICVRCHFRQLVMKEEGESFRKFSELLELVRFQASL